MKTSKPRVVLVAVMLAALAGSGSAQETKAKPNMQALSVAIDQDMVKARYDRAKAAARAGHEQDALDDYLWLFDVGMVSVKSYMGVRTSFLVSSIGELAKTYPPARQALLERCSDAELKLLASPNDRTSVVEFAGICAALKDEDRMMKVFESLPRDDARRQAFGIRAFRVLFTQKRYTDALTAIPFGNMMRTVDLNASRSVPASMDARALEMMRQSDIRSAIDYTETLAGAGQDAEAKTMIEKLKGLDASDATQRALETALKRAGRPELATPGVK